MSGIDGLILAGGQSRRMGSDKASLSVQGSTLLEHLAEMMAPVTGHLFVAGNVERLPRRLPMLQAIPDALPGHEGPLSGLLAGLNASTAPYLWVMPCDTFGFTSALLPELQQALAGAGADIACLTDSGRDHPLFALVRNEVKLSLRAYLQTGQRAVMPWLSEQKVVRCQPQWAGKLWWNINTPDTFNELLASLDNTASHDKAQPC